MKLVLYLICLGLTGLVTYQGVAIYRDSPAVLSLPAETEVPDRDGPASAEPSRIRKNRSARTWERAIVQRNLFNVSVDRPGPGKPEIQNLADLKKTNLKLRLLGTVSGENSRDCWAVIQDGKQKKQALYRVGDRIQGTEIRGIFRNRVVLTVNGKDEVLEARTGPAPGKGSVIRAVNQTPPARTPSGRPAGSANLAKPGSLLRSAKSRPHIKDGTPQGLLVYGIGPASGLASLGLKNGDIIQTVNGTDIRTSGDLTAVAEDMDEQPDIEMTLIRQGKPTQIDYNGQGRDFTVRAIEE